MSSPSEVQQCDCHFVRIVSSSLNGDIHHGCGVAIEGILLVPTHVLGAPSAHRDISLVSSTLPCAQKRSCMSKEWPQMTFSKVGPMVDLSFMPLERGTLSSVSDESLAGGIASTLGGMQVEGARPGLVFSSGFGTFEPVVVSSSWEECPGTVGRSTPEGVSEIEGVIWIGAVEGISLAPGSSGAPVVITEEEGNRLVGLLVWLSSDRTVGAAIPAADGMKCARTTLSVMDGTGSTSDKLAELGKLQVAVRIREEEQAGLHAAIGSDPDQEKLRQRLEIEIQETTRLGFVSLLDSISLSNAIQISMKSGALAVFEYSYQDACLPRVEERLSRTVRYAIRDMRRRGFVVRYPLAIDADRDARNLAKNHLAALRLFHPPLHTSLTTGEYKRGDLKVTSEILTPEDAHRRQERDDMIRILQEFYTRLSHHTFISVHFHTEVEREDLPAEETRTGGERSDDLHSSSEDVDEEEPSAEDILNAAKSLNAYPTAFSVRLSHCPQDQGDEASRGTSMKDPLRPASKLLLLRCGSWPIEEGGLPGWAQGPTKEENSADHRAHKVRFTGREDGSLSGEPFRFYLSHDRGHQEKTQNWWDIPKLHDKYIRAVFDAPEVPEDGSVSRGGTGGGGEEEDSGSLATSECTVRDYTREMDKECVTKPETTKATSDAIARLLRDCIGAFAAAGHYSVGTPSAQFNPRIFLQRLPSPPSDPIAAILLNASVEDVSRITGIVERSRISREVQRAVSKTHGDHQTSCKALTRGLLNVPMPPEWGRERREAAQQIVQERAHWWAIEWLSLYGSAEDQNAACLVAFRNEIERLSKDDEELRRLRSNGREGIDFST